MPLLFSDFQLVVALMILPPGPPLYSPPLGEGPFSQDTVGFQKIEPYSFREMARCGVKCRLASSSGPGLVCEPLCVKFHNPRKMAQWILVQTQNSTESLLGSGQFPHP